MTSSSTQGIKTVLHPVSDLEAAKFLPGGAPQGMTSPVACWQPLQDR